jgi:hypothetical protein
LKLDKDLCWRKDCEWSSQNWTVIVHGNVLSPVAWSNNSRFLFYQAILEKDEPVRRFKIMASLLYSRRVIS